MVEQRSSILVYSYSSGRRNPPVGSSHPQRISRVCKLRGCSCNAATAEEEEEEEEGEGEGRAVGTSLGVEVTAQAKEGLVWGGESVR